MSPKLNREHIIITGTSRGLGKEIAAQLIEAGYTVTGCSRSAAPAEFTIQKSGFYKHIVADLTDNSAIEALLEEVKNSKASCLILNAAQYAPFDPDDAATFDKQLKVNFIFPLQVLNKLNNMQLLQQLRVINISSVMAFVPDEVNPLYSAAKAGVSEYVKALQWNKNANLSLLNIYVGPMDVTKQQGILKQMAYSSYKEVAGQVVKQMNTKTTSAYIPGIWRLAHRIIPTMPQAFARNWIFKNRRVEKK